MSATTTTLLGRLTEAAERPGDWDISGLLMDAIGALTTAKTECGYTAAALRECASPTSIIATDLIERMNRAIKACEGIE